MRLTGLVLLIVGAVALVPMEGALAADNAFQPTLPGAESAIRAAYAQAFTGGGDQAHALAAVDDGPALAGTLALAAQNFPQAVETAQVTVSNVTFNNLFNAKVRFHITYQGGADFGERDGTAVFVNLKWKVSRETYCTVMGWAGATCPPRAGLPPLNPAAAQNAIRQAYAQAFTGGQDPAVVLAAIEGGQGLAGTLAQAAQNYPDIVASSTVTTSDIVFTDPWHAWVRYHISYQGGGLGSTGTAVISDGHWKVSRATYCSVASLLGAVCPAP
ncbi:hypothetical protein [Pseudofrankia sp. EUN1h]|uniref:hypothetical protein n=1 Tax=Pseudofrankia sp. EUN1h TaxID=1834515 RepID=UPI0002EB50CC|nr:hypothetical protein [Pseudofrankia sp. EUN1h]